MRELPTLSGDIDGEWFKRLLDAVRELQTVAVAGVGAGLDFQGNFLSLLKPFLLRSYVKNTMVTDVDQYGIMGLDTSIEYDPSSGDPGPVAIFRAAQPTFHGVIPDLSVHRAKYAIALEPIIAGGVGECILAGVIQCKVNINNAGDRYADVLTADSSQLDSMPYGSAEILFPSTGTGTQWCLVRVGAPQPAIIYGKVIADTAVGDTTVDVYPGNLPDGSDARTDLTVTLDTMLGTMTQPHVTTYGLKADEVIPFEFVDDTHGLIKGQFPPRFL